MIVAGASLILGKTRSYTFYSTFYDILYLVYEVRSSFFATTFDWVELQKWFNPLCRMLIIFSETELLLTFALGPLIFFHNTIKLLRSKLWT